MLAELILEEFNQEPDGTNAHTLLEAIAEVLEIEAPRVADVAALNRAILKTVLAGVIVERQSPAESRTLAATPREHVYGHGKVMQTRIVREGVRGLAIQNVNRAHVVGSVEPGWGVGDKYATTGTETFLWFGADAVGGINSLQTELALLRTDIERDAAT